MWLLQDRNKFFLTPRMYKLGTKKCPSYRIIVHGSCMAYTKTASVRYNLNVRGLDKKDNL